MNRWAAQQQALRALTEQYGPLLPIKTVATHFGYREDAVEALIQAGLLECVTTKDGRWIPQASLDAYREAEVSLTYDALVAAYQHGHTTLTHDARRYGCLADDIAQERLLLTQEPDNEQARTRVRQQIAWHLKRLVEIGRVQVIGYRYVSPTGNSNAGTLYLPSSERGDDARVLASHDRLIPVCVDLPMRLITALDAAAPDRAVFIERVLRAALGLGES